MTAFLCALVLFQFNLFVSPADTTEPAPPDTTEVVPDTLNGEQPPPIQSHFGDVNRDTLERRPDPVVIPMEQQIPLGYNKVFDDSLHRWEQWYNLAERESYRTGAITYRLGAHGRNDGIMFRAFEPRHRRVYFDGIRLNDPVTGAWNTNLLPHDRMRWYAEQTEGSVYRSYYELDRFYVLKPLTWVNYEETAHNVRRAEGIITQNINRMTNIELAYRGVNDDGEYRRNQLSGRLATVRLTRYLNDRWTAQALLFYNSLQMNEPEGFVINDPLAFNFIPTQTLAESANSRSSLRSTLLSASAYYRPDPEEPVLARIHVYNQRYRRFYESEPDTSFHRTLTWGVNASAALNTGAISFEPYADASHTYVDEDQNRSLDYTSWNSFTGGARVSVYPADFTELNAWSEFSYRSDDELGFEFGYRVDIQPLSTLSLYQSLSYGQLIPTIQQKYWDTALFSGNPDIRPEQIARLEAGLTWSRGWVDALGFRVYGNEIRSPILNDLETGEFINIDSYQSVGAEAFARVETDLIEAEVSTTAQTYLSSSARVENQTLDLSGYRIWNRASFHVKNYFFDFATFAKVGARFHFSPNPYFGSRYISHMDYWDPISDSFEIPAYMRLDLEASARVRNLIVLFRYENLLDNVSQLGYFETAPYPMPSRRYRVGVRWILRN